MKKVYILYKFLPHYRKAFFEELRTYLIQHDIELNLIYGKMKNSDSLKKDEVEISWANYKENKVFKLGNKELYWQPCLTELKDADLVIVEQANKLLINYILLFSRLISKRKVAFWGHGKNMQDNPNSFFNKFKKLSLNQCDWWFAYTIGVKDYLIANNVNKLKITNVQNSIDTSKLVSLKQSISSNDLQELKRDMNISSDNICIYCGGMYKEKQLKFLIKSCMIIKKSIPNFNMIFIGAGIDSYIVEDASNDYDWIHYLGPKFGIEKVKFFMISKYQLMPGLVGLGVVDSFALETPIITTNYPFHSPEIEYLVDGYNGLQSDFEYNLYANKVIEAINDPRLEKNLKHGCLESKEKYTLMNMVNNFAEGVLKCLEH